MIGDLHCHSKCSDGSLGIEDIIFYSKRIGLDYIAITDHDTMAGVEPACVLGKRLAIEIIPGVEISTSDYRRNRPVHILCYFPNDKGALQNFLNQTLRSRTATKLQMIKKIMALYPVSLEHIERYSNQSQSIHKCHIIQALADLGYTNVVVGPLMNRLISSRGSCYIPNSYPDVYEAISIIKQVGGIAVMAHPGQFDSLELLEELAAKKMLQGVEYNHPRNDEETRKKIQYIALKYNLITTGGSDFHGQYADNPNPLGSFTCSDDSITELIRLAKYSKN
jgi:phosphoribosyl 1,2-cyclic phosphate 1,2-diphosphodiesterase